MSLSQAAAWAEKAMGHGDNAVTAQDVSNPANNPAWGDPTEKMKALCWVGKNKVEMSQSALAASASAVDDPNYSRSL